MYLYKKTPPSFPMAQLVSCASLVSMHYGVRKQSKSSVENNISRKMKEQSFPRNVSKTLSWDLENESEFWTLMGKKSIPP